MSQAFTNQAIANPELSQPHFDDERTLRAARKVVPLKRIPARSHKRAWLLAGAFVMAIWLGAASALVAVYLKQGPVDSATVVASASDTTPPLENAVSETETTATEPEPIDSILFEITPEDPPKKQVLMRKARVVATSTATEQNSSHAPAPTVSEPVVEDTVDDQPILVDQWEERRQRRAVRRERRLRENQESRDLFHIDEIFRGSRRRPRY